ncbi:MAG: hypothetical protein H6774_04735 [Pseudomonadales bacterium]|nr:hypothetical protein [Candidatus Woesebacteria bacterium]MCB9802357.1 hypothetical protein [Pseudomonadales bacterium]
MKHALLTTTWWIAAIYTALGLSLALYYLPTHDKTATQVLAIHQSQVEQNSSTTFETDDARALIVANFLERYNSPLRPYNHYGAVIVEIADRHNIDFRLLPAIAMQESSLCKATPPGSYNCLGFGVHSQGTLGFDSYEAGFERAARELKANYIDIGLVTPEQIMTKYTPSSNGSWASSVNQWMAEMRYDDRTKGRTHKTNADLLEFVE